MHPAISAYADFYHGLNAGSLDRIEQLFSEQALFRDPFNQVRGPKAIRRIFEDLLRRCPEPGFEITETIGDLPVVFMRWNFRPRRDGDLCIDGVSRIMFDGDGKVQEHLDYWDSNSQLFAHLPVVGACSRWAARRLTAHPPDQVNA